MTIVRKSKWYGWKPDLPDARDTYYKVTHLMANLPPSVDLYSQCPPVYDQGDLGSCTGNSIAGAIQFLRKKEGLPDFIPSRLFIYYNERAIEDTVSSDSGAEIRDGIKSVAEMGDCPETEWPYDISQFSVKPPVACFTNALKDRAVSYARLNNENIVELKSCLASGYPFVYGFTVYSSFESDVVAKTGVVPMPNLTTEEVLGGHAVMCVGYDDATSTFKTRNSWGYSWGMPSAPGYFTIPYNYLTNTNLASDFWVIKIVSTT